MTRRQLFNPQRTPYEPDSVRVATRGNLWIAPEDSPLPYPKDPMDYDKSPWRGMGLLTEEGVEHGDKRETEEIKTWQMGTVRAIEKGRTITLKFSVVESSMHTLTAYYGENPASIPSQKGAKMGGWEVLIHDKVARGRFATVFEYFDINNNQWRLHFPASQISETEAPKFQATKEVQWGMTILAIVPKSYTFLAHWQVFDKVWDEEARKHGLMPPDEDVIQENYVPIAA